MGSLNLLVQAVAGQPVLVQMLLVLTGVLLRCCSRLILCPRHAKRWLQGASNEIGRLAQGMPGKPFCTNTMHFVPFSAMPDGPRSSLFVTPRMMS